MDKTVGNTGKDQDVKVALAAQGGEGVENDAFSYKRFERATCSDQNLTFTKTKESFIAGGLPFSRNEYRKLNMLTAEGEYTNFALLLSDQSPFVLKLASFSSDGGRMQVSEREELRGSVIWQYERAISFIMKSSFTRSQDLFKTGSAVFPEDAVRAAVANALIHRDYCFAVPNLIRLYDDNLEIISVGGLVPGFTQADIDTGITVTRNEGLESLFAHLGLTESCGTGLRRIFVSYEGNDEMPKIEVTANAFRLTLPSFEGGNGMTRSSYHPEVMPRPEVIPAEPSALPPLVPEKKDNGAHMKEVCRIKGSIVRKDIENELGISQASAILLLRKMVGEKQLKKEGLGKNSKYVIP